MPQAVSVPRLLFPLLAPCLSRIFFLEFGWGHHLQYPCQVLSEGFQSGLLGVKIQSALIKAMLSFIPSLIFFESICQLDGWIKIRFKKQPEKNHFPGTNTPLPIQALPASAGLLFSWPVLSHSLSSCPTSHSSMHVGGSKPPRWPGPKER